MLPIAFGKSAVVSGLALRGAALALGLALLATPAAAELGKPPLGRVDKWLCKGAHAQSYVTKLLSAEDGLIRVEEQVDGVVGWSTRPDSLFGLNLFKERDRGDGKGVTTLEFDPEDFAGYAQLQPGTSFSADVGESDNNSTRDWRYDIEIGQPETVQHDLLGTVEVIPVIESRWVYRGKDSSTFAFLIVPATAQIVRWRYSDAEGTQDCELYLTFKKKLAQ